MSELTADDVAFLHEILRSDEEDDLIFGKPRRSVPPPCPISIPVKPIRSSPRSPSVGSGSSRRFSPSSSRTTCQKCAQIFMGGSDLPEGLTPDLSDPHFCANLFCVSCDHKVIRFKDRKWKDSTDYLFLRNNYPNKVAQNLAVAPRWSACCCQCTFCSDQSIRKLPTFSTNWVCRGHE
jgi:hypothetical protein